MQTLFPHSLFPIEQFAARAPLTHSKPSEADFQIEFVTKPNVMVVSQPRLWIIASLLSHNVIILIQWEIWTVKIDFFSNSFRFYCKKLKLKVKQTVE